jgi:hypothetical protein
MSQKAKTSLQSQKTKFMIQNQYVIFIDWKYYMKQEKTYIQGSKGENKPTKPQHGVWASSNISIDREFYMKPG